jgi:hypothetical protein
MLLGSMDFDSCCYGLLLTDLSYVCIHICKYLPILVSIVELIRRRPVVSFMYIFLSIHGKVKACLSERDQRTERHTYGIL